MLPLFALGLGLLGDRGGRLADPATRARLVTVLGAGYAGLVALVTWQAERGQSLVHPDAWTSGVGAVLVAAVIGAAVPVLARRGPVRQTNECLVQP